MRAARAAEAVLLAALTRRWTVVAISATVYLVTLEPVLGGLPGEAHVWLPRAATSALSAPGPDPKLRGEEYGGERTRLRPETGPLVREAGFVRVCPGFG